ncbi:hypothetical protein HB162lentus_15130 [Mammaliicoccus lentus]|jgi:4-carboxymuconolactone decarboxylase|nr:Uncharacterised protein [Mammaliicoccus lentus]
MESNRCQQGISKLMEFTTTTGSMHLKITEDMKDITPDVSKYIIEFAYGDIYSNKGLTN